MTSNSKNTKTSDKVKSAYTSENTSQKNSSKNSSVEPLPESTRPRKDGPGGA